MEQTLSEIPRLKLFEELKRVFPTGTRHPGPTRNAASPLDDKEWLQPPLWPQDLFAVTGHLLHLSGAFNYLLPPGAPAELVAQGRYLALNPERVRLLQKLGETWRESDTIDINQNLNLAKRLKLLWNYLLLHRDDEVYRLPRHEDDANPKWWRAAFYLFTIADEACADIGWVQQTGTSYFAAAHYTKYSEHVKNEAKS